MDVDHVAAGPEEVLAAGAASSRDDTPADRPRGDRCSGWGSWGPIRKSKRMKKNVWQKSAEKIGWKRFGHLTETTSSLG